MAGGTGIFGFGSYRLDLARRSLSREGEELHLAPKEFETLALLVGSHRRVLSKDELISAVWPDTFVGDGSLARNISVLRALLGEGYIETVPRIGYRFAAKVEEIAEGISTPPDFGLGGVPPALTTGASAAWKPRLLGAALLVVAIAVSALWKVPSRWSGPTPQPARIRVAVLPVVNLTGDPNRDYIADGLTEAMISDLSRQDPVHMGVIARTSSMRYKSVQKPLEAMVRELNVDYLIETSLRSSGETYRLTLQIIRSSDLTHVDAREYEEDGKDVLRLHRELSEAVTSEVRTALRMGGASLAADLPAPEAYRLYLRGEYHLRRRNPKDARLAVSLFSQATEADPGYAKAWGGLAEALALLDRQAESTDSRPELERLAFAAAQKSLQLNPTLGAALVAQGQLLEQTGRPAQAEAALRRALQLNPNDTDAHYNLGLLLQWYLDRHAEALVELERALELDPVYSPLLANAGEAYAANGQEKRGLELMQRAVELEPDSVLAHGKLGTTYLRRGDFERALTEFKKAKQFSEGPYPYMVPVGLCYAKLGQKEKTREILKQLEGIAQKRPVPQVFFASLHGALDERNEAFRYLRLSLRTGEADFVSLNNESLVADLRADARFQQLATIRREPRGRR